jgi:hypothetical protein
LYASRRTRAIGRDGALEIVGIDEVFPAASGSFETISTFPRHSSKRCSLSNISSNQSMASFTLPIWLCPLKRLSPQVAWSVGSIATPLQVKAVANGLFDLLQ